MINNIIQLRPDDPDITLTTYVANAPSPIRSAVLVIPGGGYGCICDDREGEPIALAFLAAGINAFVLRYSVGKKALFPRPLVDASLAMQHIRTHAEEYHTDPNRVFACGFSAGGHLCGALGSLWHLDSVREALPDMPAGMNRPTGMILCYAVLTAFEKPHKGSYINILGTDSPTDEQLDRYSIDKHIDERTCPAFLMHTANDQVVPVENALCTAQALSAAKIPFEMHIFPDAPHGVALGNWQTACGNPAYDNPSISTWVSSAVAWMNRF